MTRSMFSVLAVGSALLLFSVRNLACGPPALPSAVPPLEGEVAITEVMADPLTGDPEWIELRSTADVPLDLGGCTLSDGGESTHLAFVPPLVHLPPGSFLVVAEQPLQPDDLETHVVLGDGALVLASSDPEERLRLHCPGDEGLVAVDEAPLGALGASAPGVSWMLAEGEAAASRNDDPGAWFAAPDDPIYAEDEAGARRGTPGWANLRGGRVLPWPAPGDVQVSEVMVAPDLGREWFEVRSLADEAFDLAGCLVGEEGGGPVHEHVLDPERGATALQPDRPLVLAASGLDIVPGDAVVADYAYTTLTFNNGEHEELYLRCGDREVERVGYDWVTHDADRGRSLSRDPDDPELWCVADESFHLDGDVAEYGSPGAANPPCPRLVDGPPYPIVGEVVITEIMVAPSSGDLFPEWFEVAVVGDREVQLDGCRVEDLVGDGALHVTSALGPGELALLGEDAFDPVCALEFDGDYGGGVTFNNGSPDRCALVCPDGEGGWEVVDEVLFDWAGLDLDKGVSLVLDADAVDAELNDDPGRWCPAPEDAWSCTVDGYTDRGNPGTLSSCGAR